MRSREVIVISTICRVHLNFVLGISRSSHNSLLLLIQILSPVTFYLSATHIVFTCNTLQCFSISVLEMECVVLVHLAMFLQQCESLALPIQRTRAAWYLARVAWCVRTTAILWTFNCYTINNWYPTVKSIRSRNIGTLDVWFWIKHKRVSIKHFLPRLSSTSTAKITIRIPTRNICGRFCKILATLYKNHVYYCTYIKHITISLHN